MGTSAILDAGAPQTAKGVRTQHLWIDGFEGRRVPGLVLLPEDAVGQRPAVLLGHGAGMSKEESMMLRIARWLVRREGWAVVLIDGPLHGERQPANSTDIGQEAREALTRPETYQEMTVDWQRTVDACGELPDVGNERIAYLGFSMGTLLGVPAVASDARFRCAAFAVGGIIGAQPNLLSDAAAQITQPTLQINQSEDEIFSRDAAFRLYDALAGPKRIFFHPGLHSGIPREGMERVREFLHAHLTAEGDETGAPPSAW